MRISDWSSDVCSSDLGSVACIERANHRADLTEDCAFLGNGEVTTHLKDIAAADSKTVNAGNHGLLKALDRVVHLQGWQHASVKIGLLASVFAAPGAAQFVASASQDHSPGAGLGANR